MKLAKISQSIKLDLEHVPLFEEESSTQSQNRTLILNGFNNSVELMQFRCPFKAKPEPEFEWRILDLSLRSDKTVKSKGKLDNEFRKGEKIFRIDRYFSDKKSSIQYGRYEIECRAKSTGISNEISDTVKIFVEYFK
jgi:hypothetical protein